VLYDLLFVPSGCWGWGSIALFCALETSIRATIATRVFAELTQLLRQLSVCREEEGTACESRPFFFILDSRA
jgi:hypothetical protein